LSYLKAVIPASAFLVAGLFCAPASANTVTYGVTINLLDEGRGKPFLIAAFPSFDQSLGTLESESTSYTFSASGELSYQGGGFTGLMPYSFDVQPTIFGTGVYFQLGAPESGVMMIQNGFGLAPFSASSLTEVDDAISPGQYWFITNAIDLSPGGSNWWLWYDEATLSLDRQYVYTPTQADPAPEPAMVWLAGMGIGISGVLLWLKNEKRMNHAAPRLRG
jgi:hypothetical protein